MRKFLTSEKRVSKTQFSSGKLGVKLHFGEAAGERLETKWRPRVTNEIAESVAGEAPREGCYILKKICIKKVSAA